MVVNAVLNLDYDGCCLGQNTLYTGTGTMILIPTAATTHNASESITNNWITDTTTLVGFVRAETCHRRHISQLHNISNKSTWYYRISYYHPLHFGITSIMNPTAVEFYGQK